jgi:hypothetical protein
MKSLKERTQEFDIQLPIMKDRTKGDLDSIKEMTVTIRDFGFMTAVDKKTKLEKEFACFIIDEDPACFYFGGQVVTDNLKKLEADGYTEEIQAEGLPVEFVDRHSDTSGNDYTAIIYYPEPKEEKPANKGKGKK